MIETHAAALDDVPVYIKYNSSDGGNAYMKPFPSNFTGVIFQPKMNISSSSLTETEFYQFGDLPCSLFQTL